jgi:5'-3' exonuclease
MKTTLVIDGNALGYSSNYAAKLSAGDQQTQAIFGTFKSIAQLKRTFKPTDCLVLWDGRAKWRYELLPTYKSNRESTPEKKAERDAYKTQRPFIVEGLKALGVKQITVFNSEADDLAAYFSKKLTAEPNSKVILATGDKDWLQLITPQVDWYDPIRDEYVDAKRFLAFTGYKTSRAFVESKALQGDNSDTIGGVGGVGEKRAKDLLDKYGSALNFIKTPAEEVITECKALRDFHANKEAHQTFVRNIHLMSLYSSIDRIDFANKEVINGAIDLEAFREICMRFAFSSILAKFDEFVIPFTGEAL